MPRLPSEYDLGGLPSSLSGRPIAVYDGGQVGEGVSAVGKGISDLGVGIKKQQDAVDDLDFAKAKSSWLTNKVNLDDQASNITDPTELAGHQEKYKQAITDSAALISDPAKRQRFIIDSTPNLAKAEVAVGDRVKALQRDQTLASTQTGLDDLQNAGLKAKDEATRMEIIGAGKAKIDALEKEGYVSAQQAASMRKSWGDGYRTKIIQSLTPEQRLQAVKPIQVDESAKTAIKFFQSKGWTPEQAAAIAGGLFVESGFNTNANNAGDGADGSDSIGVGQWNSGRAVALKAFAASKGKPANDFMTQLEFVQHELDTSEGKAAAKLRAATDVESATNAFLHYERPHGYEGGIATASNGLNRLRAAKSYHGNAIGAGTSREARLAEGLPEDVKSTIAAQAEGEIRQQERTAQAGRQQDLTNLNVSLGDDLASVERTGQGLVPDVLNKDKITKLAGEDAARQWEADRVRSYKVYEALDGIDQLPEGDVERRLQKMEPVPGSPGYADDMKAYDRARTKASKFLEARRSDPALASEVFTSVRAARQNAQYDDNNGARSIQPASAQAIVRARLAAQGQLGIQEPMAITKSEASVIARQLRSIGEENPDGMRKFMESLNRTYGDYADEVLAATIQHQNVARDLSVMASSVLSKVAQGTMPGSPEVKRIESLIDSQVMSKAMPPPPALPPELRARRDAFGQSQQNAIRQQAQDQAIQERQQPGSGSPALATDEGMADIKRLVQDPSLATDFDIKYNTGGPGMAEKIIKDYRRKKGIAPNG